MEDLVSVARDFAFVRETMGPNRGAFVSFMQRFCHGVDGDSWCCDFVSMVEDIVYHGDPPTLRTGSCQLKLGDARRQGFVTPVAAVGDLYFFVSPNGVAHHVGIVTSIAPLTGIAGNTSSDGLSSDGTGVFEHEIHGGAMTFVRLPKPSV